MEKYFVCLANSYKHGGRCIAGVEVEWIHEHWRIVRNEYGCPKWIRPLSRQTGTGEIPKELALNFMTLEIVKLEGVLDCGYDAQTENVYYDKMLPIGKHYEKTTLLLEKFIDESHRHVLYNYGKGVSPEVCQNRGFYSILLIRASCSEVYAESGFKDYPRYRIKFSYRGHNYDFPITDSVYLQDLRSGRCLPGYKGTTYITCSLGLEHEGWHPKLAACVFEVESVLENANLGKNQDDKNKEDWFSDYEQELYQLTEQKKMIDKRIKEIRTNIIQKMQQFQMKKITSSLFVIDFVPAKVLTSFDRESFKKDHEDLYNAYCKSKQKDVTIVVKRNSES